MSKYKSNLCVHQTQHPHREFLPKYKQRSSWSHRNGRSLVKNNFKLPKKKYSTYTLLLSLEFD